MNEALVCGQDSQKHPLASVCGSLSLLEVSAKTETKLLATFCMKYYIYRNFLCFGIAIVLVSYFSI